jgi:hypothetical protein
VFVDSLLAAAVPTPLLLQSNPALATHVLQSAASLAGASPACSPTLPLWWHGQDVNPLLSVRLWCAEALRCLALCDRIHRVVEVTPPSVPVSSDSTPTATDKGSKAPKAAAAAAAPSKDLGGAKKSAKQHKADSTFDAASTLAAVNAALKPIAPALSFLLPGLDSDAKVRAAVACRTPLLRACFHPRSRLVNRLFILQTSSIGERVSGLVTRHAVLLARLTSVSSRTSDAVMSPELNEALAALSRPPATPRAHLQNIHQRCATRAGQL